MGLTDWPLHPGSAVEYSIRTSPRARYVRLLVSARDGLTVVIPTGFDPLRVPAIVEKRRGWIESHLGGLADPAAGAAADDLPERIDLPALGESWHVEYVPATTRLVGVVADAPERISVCGSVHDREACREALKHWLCLRAREELVPRLAALARQGGFKFNEVLIRGQKTRWGSCSSRGTISLSFKLLFLERDWVRCVLLHELCHTVEMNHSAEFWSLLGTHEPGCRAIHRRMRDGWKRIPGWVEARGKEDRRTPVGLRLAARLKARGSAA